MISPAQCRAARAWLGIEQKTLGDEAGCIADTIRRFENNKHQLRPATLARLRAALEARGIVFTFGRDGEALGIEKNPHFLEKSS